MHDVATTTRDLRLGHRVLHTVRIVTHDSGRITRIARCDCHETFRAVGTTHLATERRVRRLWLDHARGGD